MKKLLFLLLATILPAMAEAYDAYIDGIYYNFDKEARTATVTHRNYNEWNQNAYSGTVNIPATVIYNGELYDVTSIGSFAFQYCNNLTSITIPSSVVSIGSEAFSGTGWLNNQLDGILYLDKWLIGYKGEKPTGTYVVAEETKGIANNAFLYCSNLTTVTMPNSIKYIGNQAFYGCSGLASITIPNGVTSIRDGVFNNCSGLISITIPNSVAGIGNWSFGNCSSLTSVAIPNSVTNIGNNAFNGCKGLTEMMIPESITSIGYGAFDGCINLFSVTIPNSVTNIGNWAFAICRSLTSITIPNNVTSIGEGTFADCISLTSITIPNSVTSIGDQAFYACSSLTSVTIPNSVSTIGESAFQDCSKVEKIRLPDNLQIIKKATCKGCNSLKSVTIPSTVEVIYQEAFADNNNMENVKALPETPPFLYDNSFSNYNIPLYASKTAIAAYQAKEPWSKFVQFLTLDGQEVEVPQCATPTIDYSNWKVTFSCETEGAEIVAKAVCSDTQEGNGEAISLMPTYTITAYAKAEGYRDSDVTTATIGWKNGRPVIIRGFSNIDLEEGEPICDVNNDGAVDVADIATIISAMASKSREGGAE